VKSFRFAAAVKEPLAKAKISFPTNEIIIGRDIFGDAVIEIKCCELSAWLHSKLLAGESTGRIEL
jgi:hypothetical protein